MACDPSRKARTAFNIFRRCHIDGIVDTLCLSSTSESFRRNGRYRMNAPEQQQARNNALLEIRGLGGNDAGRKLWKSLKGYHRRSLAETGMYRFKTLFGADLKCRSIQGQHSEAYTKGRALNIMTGLGMPRSERVSA
jgi:hypothetical protein